MPEFVTLDDFNDVRAVGVGWPVEATSAHDLTMDEFLVYLRDVA